MPRYMGKGLLSLKELQLANIEILNNGYISDENVIEVRSTIEEYNRRTMLINDQQGEISGKTRKIDILESNNSKLESNLNIAKNRLEKERSETESLKKSSDLKISELSESINNLSADLDKEQKLNDNLMRIMRERANALRGIRPRKAHDGYIVLSSRQFEQHYTYTYTGRELNDLPYEIRRAHRYSYTEHRTALCWRTTIQTPHDASLPFETIKDTIGDTLILTVLPDLGCTRNYPLDDFEFEDYYMDEMNLYRILCNANFRSGFWECDVFTTRPLEIPAGRREPPKAKPAGGKKSKKKGSSSKISPLEETESDSSDDLYGRLSETPDWEDTNRVRER